MTATDQHVEPEAMAVRESVEGIRRRPSTRVLVVGGGINGLATFRELALQGIDVVLVERNDFASGATAASSHMIHGGIRYLENGEFRLVRESVQERNGLLKIAPHYVRPLRTTMPIFSTVSGVLSAPLRILTHRPGRPKERGALLIAIGMTAYDVFSRDGGTLPKHRVVGRRKALADLPKFNPDVKYSGTYFDASVHDPERLALDVLRDGLAAGDHARAANYVEAIGATADGVLLRDTESGEQFTVRPELVVNASGPWTDLTNEAFGAPTTFMGGTKGSHIVLDNPELLEATGGREIFFENSDGRIVLIYPLKGRVLVGTTDLEADPRQTAVCTDEEIDYFFDLIAHVFPAVAVDRSQIVFTFSGIRPLPKHDDLQPGFVSRDYRIERTPSERLGYPVLSLVGGKWTTFRALGERLADQVIGLLSARRTVSTAGIPIGGGKGFPTNESDRQAWVCTNLPGLSPERGRELLERYGTRAADVAAFLAGGEDTPIPGASVTEREVRYFADAEHAVHLDDVLLRRTSLAFEGRLSSSVLDAVGAAMARAMGWDDERLSRELTDTARLLSERHRVGLEIAAG